MIGNNGHLAEIAYMPPKGLREWLDKNADSSKTFSDMAKQATKDLGFRIFTDSIIHSLLYMRRIKPKPFSKDNNKHHYVWI